MADRKPDRPGLANHRGRLRGPSDPPDGSKNLRNIGPQRLKVNSFPIQWQCYRFEVSQQALPGYGIFLASRQAAMKIAF
jgi:hypothetical protein